ncbi:MAG: cytochrome ubiquinol oxidase subunit I [Eggerthellaceae bacterium]|jgi:cytochrome d ubiquinol oxidase subunit I|nr:cytochrome ubiquinol oxidase subunit I [Eggerthellaceae bacterium]MDR2721693.1 cytochrome ubiquinol oxidase subunit I [Coriobacteriaceae bacterium]
MDILSDVAVLSRIQFAATAAFHFFFVPLSIGLGLILAINETRYYKTRDPKDAAATKLWVKIFTATFVVGVATGITMEFAFGANWANYSRFVGDIFGAPLAAEALLSFFLESVFLGVLVFGRKKVSPKFFMVSAWLVWFASMLSALWILLANSWMQTPAGAELQGGRAVLVDFFAAALNPSLFARYTHTVNAVLIMGAFFAMSVAAWFFIKNRNEGFALKTMRIGATVAIVTSCLMLVFAHASGVVVANEQPTKMAMMEGAYETEASPLYLFGWVDEANGTTSGLKIPGATSFLATGDWNAALPGLNDLAQDPRYGGNFKPEELPVNLVFQTYHIMLAMYLLILLSAILAIIFSFGKGKIKDMKWLQRLLFIAPVFPFLAIQTGWITAEVGRQPWVVYPGTSSPAGVSQLTSDGISMSLSSVELLITLLLFLVVYTFLFVAWARMMSRFIKAGPLAEDEVVAELKGGE